MATFRPQAPSRLRRLSTRLALCLPTAFALSAGPITTAAAEDAPFYAPDDQAWLTVGWAGAESLAPAYDASVLGQLLGPDVKQMDLGDVVRWAERSFDDFDLGQPDLRNTLTLATAVRDWPLRIEFVAPAPPRITIEPAAVNAAKALAAAQALADQTQGEVAVTQTDRLITASLPGMEGPANRAGAPAALMTDLASTLDAPAVSLYANARQITGFAMSQARLGDTETELLAELGALGVDTLGLVAGFDADGLWRTEAAINLREDQPAGLWAITQGPGLTAADLAPVPAGTTSLAAVQLDLPTVKNELQGALLRVDPDLANTVDQVNQAPSVVFGSDLDTLAAMFGPTWVAYVDPGAVGGGSLGAVVVNRPSDPQALQDALEAANAALAALVKGALASQRDAPNLYVRFFNIERDGVTLRTLPAGLVQPTWTVVDGLFIAGLSPQAVLHAARHAKNAGADITTNPTFQQAWANGQPADGGALRAFGYNDRAVTLEAGYGTGVHLSGLVSSPYAVVTGGLTPMLLPTWAEAKPLIQPSWWAVTRQANALHVTSVANTPVDSLIGLNAGPLAAVAPLGAMTGVMLPALGAARETARQVEDLSDLRQIGLGVALYANDHRGDLPDNLAQVDEYMNGFQPRNPVIYVKPAENIDQVRDAAGTILAYTLSDHGDTAAVVFVDGHAERLQVWDLEDRLRQQTGQGLQQPGFQDHGGPVEAPPRPPFR
ncbi:MAG: hypothetical protein AAF288_12085 [Planctomycetota bacterium]